MKKRPPPAVLAVIVLVHLVIVHYVWRDLGRRDAAQVRGSKRLWRIATGANSAASVLYLLVGRRSATSAPVPVPAPA
jgi:hypothetical protein